MKKSLFCIFAFALLASLGAAAFANDAEAWRKRQCTELATVPKPAEPPAGPGTEIDRLLMSRWTKEGIPSPPVIDDRTFVRRAYLDIIGLLPTTEQLDAFLHNSEPEKRAKLVDRLLADKQAYAEHWMSFWNDLLRNDEQTSIDGLRKAITPWLYNSLFDNKPLDRFVAELLDPDTGGPDGYLKGVNWRGRVNASQTPQVQAAQNVSQVFLASSIKCASCHNSFVNQWKLADAYGMASFFSATNLEMHRCDKPTGKIVPPKFLFPDMGDIAPTADLETRHRAVSEMVTRPKNPRFARTVINRLWKKLLGRGLFEPVDDLDGKQPTSALLDWLAYDFMSHDYDVKHTLRLILLSRVYQAPVAAMEQKPKKPVPLHGPVERRLSSEQFLDGISQVTGYWPAVPVMNVAVANPHIRAWRQKKPDSLATALGRPNREQVCTVRDEESTVLQGLELVNGSVLAERLHGGAHSLLTSSLGRDSDPTKVAKTLYLRALGRQPSSAELALVTPLLGSPKDTPASRESGWQDCLWLLFMSPEFQFVH
jgi:hypothetical protein